MSEIVIKTLRVIAGTSTEEPTNFKAQTCVPMEEMLVDDSPVYGWL